MVVTLDDLQWADLPSLELLSYLTPTLEARRTAARRGVPQPPRRQHGGADGHPGDGLARGFRVEIPLTGLPRAIAELAVDMLGSGGDAEARDQLVTVLHERTGGNPFFVRQLARLLLESDSPTTAASRQQQRLCRQAWDTSSCSASAGCPTRHRSS